MQHPQTIDKCFGFPHDNNKGPVCLICSECSGTSSALVLHSSERINKRYLHKSVGHEIIGQKIWHIGYISHEFQISEVRLQYFGSLPNYTAYLLFSSENMDFAWRKLFA